MREVFGPKSWVFWWAGLTATIFLQQWLRQIATFFRDANIFSRKAFPFSIADALNGVIDGAANYLRSSVGFDPAAPLITSPVKVPNLAIAILIALLVLIIALVFYVRALKSPMLADDIVALFILYFVIRVEGHLLQIASSPPATISANGVTPGSTPASAPAPTNPIAAAGNAVTQNPQITFWLLMVFLVILTFVGEGFHNKRSFWRGVFEAVLVAVFFLPVVSAGWLAVLIDRIADFGGFINSNAIFGVIWGVVGFLLAVRRLYFGDAKTA